MEKKTIGKFISALRRAKGMTQKELADRLFVSDKTVSRWECDESTPDLALIPTIAEIFDITSDELLRGERRSVREETEEGEAVSEKGRRELRLMLTRRQKRFSNLSLISLALVIVALLTALMINLGFTEALVAFCVGAVLLLTGVILQLILARSSLFFGEEIELYGKDAESTNQRIKLTSARVMLAHLFALTALLPLVLNETYGEGLAFGFWFWQGALLTLGVGIAVYLLYVLAFRKRLVGWGFFEDDERKRAAHAKEKRLLLRYGLVMLSLALVVGIALSLIASLPCTAFSKGKVFTDPESFLAYMEEAKGYDYHEEGDSHITYEPIFGEIDKDFTYEDPHVSIWEVPGKDGEILYRFPYNSRYFAAIEWSFDSSEDGMPVTVYTKEAYHQGYTVQDTLILVVALLLAATELTLMIVYAVKVVGLYEKKKAQS